VENELRTLLGGRYKAERGGNKIGRQCVGTGGRGVQGPPALRDRQHDEGKGHASEGADIPANRKNATGQLYGRTRGSKSRASKFPRGAFGAGLRKKNRRGESNAVQKPTLIRKGAASEPATNRKIQPPGPSGKGPRKKKKPRLIDSLIISYQRKKELPSRESVLVGDGHDLVLGWRECGARGEKWGDLFQGKRKKSFGLRRSLTGLKIDAR